MLQKKWLIRHVNLTFYLSRTTLGHKSVCVFLCGGKVLLEKRLPHAPTKLIKKTPFKSTV